jgi:hypothetical protein
VAVSKAAFDKISEGLTEALGIARNLHVVCWVWGSKYGPEYVDRLRRGVERHLPGARVLVAEPEPADRYLTEIEGCLARLRTFDPEWQAANGIEEGSRIVVLDLDLVVTGDLTRVFDREEPFVILQGVHTGNPCLFNGSVWMLRAGYRPDVWTEFTLERAAAVPHYLFPEDQAWFAARMPDAGAFGPADGVYAFGKPGWPKGMNLPPNAKIVAFPGRRDPSQFIEVPWVRRNWIG